MATTNNVIVPNFPPRTATNHFNQFWKLTRALKKAGWKYVASADGSSNDITGDPFSDKWGSGTLTTSGANAVIAAPSRGRALVTGLSGITSVDKGRFLSITGSGTPANNHYHQIEEIISTTSVKIDARNFAVAADAGPLAWGIYDPLGTAYPTALNTVQAWYCCRGPSTLKIPITAAPTSGPTGQTFVRGENISQAVTGAEGELIGYVYYGGTGYLVVAPRRRGLGAGVHGWDTANLITGAISGASVTQVGTALEYRHEMVIWKTTTEQTGLMFHGCFETVGDAADAYSGKLGAATNTTPPGSASFPNFGWTSLGTSSVIGGAVYWNQRSSGGGNIGNAQIMCVDCIEEQNYSADGSWCLPYACDPVAWVPGGGHWGTAFCRLDDTEDGDCDPYVTFADGTVNLYTNSRTNSGSDGATDGDIFTTATYGLLTSFTQWRGWKGRGIAGDSASNFQDFETLILRAFQTGNSPALANNPTYTTRQVTALTPTKVREPIWVGSVQANRKMFKGTLRWGFWVTGGNGTDTYDNKKWIQLSGRTVPMVWGPWDETTIPYTF